MIGLLMQQSMVPASKDNCFSVNVVPSIVNVTELFTLRAELEGMGCRLVGQHEYGREGNTSRARRSCVVTGIGSKRPLSRSLRMDISGPVASA
ncbi:hypothetical protein PUN4_510022 [Paraburkholderia unamae]|nr:hypothetical protein PUN4_510022 [Paraburkholderia unamae]